MLALHSQNLLERGLDESPASTLEDLYWLWGVHGATEPDAQLSLQLASLTSFSSLSSNERLAALLCKDTRERLRWAKFALGRRKRLRYHPTPRVK